MMGTILGTIWGLFGENTTKIRRNHEKLSLKKWLKIVLFCKPQKLEKIKYNIGNEEVGGSSPLASSQKPSELCGFRGFSLFSSLLFFSFWGLFGDYSENQHLLFLSDQLTRRQPFHRQ